MWRDVLLFSTLSVVPAAPRATLTVDALPTSVGVRRRGGTSSGAGRKYRGSTVAGVGSEGAPQLRETKAVQRKVWAGGERGSALQGGVRREGER